MKWFLILLILIETVFIVSSDENTLLKDIDRLSIDDDPDINRTIEQIILTKGYPLETHYVTTKDGYVLKLYRIPGPKTTSFKFLEENQSKRAILLMHGLMDSSDSFVANREDRAIPFVLVNQGFDVWLGNNRGNKHSKVHIKYNPKKDKNFWDFSFHEMGMFDLPAMIDYIKSKTGEKKITYLGHSQGTAQMFVALSNNIEYIKENVNGFIALGPITKLANIRSKFLNLLAVTKLEEFLSFFGFHELFESNIITTKFTQFTCKKLRMLCDGVLELLADSNYNDNDPERFRVFLGHFPSGCSLKTLKNFAEMVRKKRFVNINDGTDYDLEKIKNFPISLFVGKDDELATVVDNRILKELLEKNNSLYFYREYDDVGHATFFLNKNNVFLDDIIKIVKEFK